MIAATFATVFGLGSALQTASNSDPLEVLYRSSVDRIGKFKSVGEIKARYGDLAKKWRNRQATDSDAIESLELVLILDGLSQGREPSKTLDFDFDFALMQKLRGMGRRYPNSAVPQIEMLSLVGSQIGSPLGPREDKPSKAKIVGRRQAELTYTTPDPRIPVEIKKYFLRLSQLAPQDARVSVMRLLDHQPGAWDKLHADWPNMYGHRNRLSCLVLLCREPPTLAQRDEMRAEYRRELNKDVAGFWSVFYRNRYGDTP